MSNQQLRHPCQSDVKLANRHPRGHTIVARLPGFQKLDQAWSGCADMFVAGFLGGAATVRFADKATVFI
jgi:hypothetical protein